MITGSEFVGDEYVVTATSGGTEVRLRAAPPAPEVGETVQIFTHRYLLFDRSGRRIASVG